MNNLNSSAKHLFASSGIFAKKTVMKIQTKTIVKIVVASIITFVLGYYVGLILSSII